MIGNVYKNVFESVVKQIKRTKKEEYQNRCKDLEQELIDAKARLSQENKTTENFELQSVAKIFCNMMKAEHVCNDKCSECIFDKQKYVNF